MNIRLKHIAQPLLIGLLIFLALFTVLEHQQTLNQSSSVQYKQPQEYMKHVHVTHFTETGTIKDQIKAKYWAYVPEKEISTLDTPHLIIVKPGEANWTVDAKSGRAHHPTLQSKVEKLELWDSVVVDRAKTKTHEPITVTSEKLIYFPENDYVESDLFVKLIKPGLIVTGIGMHGYLDKNWVELLKDVTTQYERVGS